MSECMYLPVLQILDATYLALDISRKAGKGNSRGESEVLQQHIKCHESIWSDRFKRHVPPGV